MQWEISVAAVTYAKDLVNDDVIGVNGWVLSGLRPMIYTSRRVLTGPEAFAVSDGIQPGYGGLGAQLIAREASSAEQLSDARAVQGLVTKLHHDLLAADYFPKNWGITPDTFRLPGATVAGVRVNHRLKGNALLLFNVGDAAIFYSADGQRSSMLSITDRTGSGMLTHAIGGGPPGTPMAHLVELPLASTNRILLCSDGLMDAVQGIEDIDRLLRQAESPRAAASSLIEAARKRVMPDDVSVLVLDVNSSGEELSSPNRSARNRR